MPAGQSEDEKKPVPIRPAASLLLVRDANDGDAHHGIEVLFLKRSLNMRFLPGYLAFPGGALDPADAVLANEHSMVEVSAQERAEDPAYAVAALRECAEELGLVCAVSRTDGSMEDQVLTQTEQQWLLNKDMSFAEYLRRHGLKLGGDRLRFVGRWVTPPHRNARFDTRFFLCAAHSKYDEFSVHPSELMWARWGSPKALLEDIYAGREQAVRPTIAMLRALSACHSVSDALDHLHVPGPDPML